MPVTLLSTHMHNIIQSSQHSYSHPHSQLQRTEGRGLAPPTTFQKHWDSSLSSSETPSTLILRGLDLPWVGTYGAITEEGWAQRRKQDFESPFSPERCKIQS